MAYFKTRDVAAIAIGAALWGVLNSVFSPVVFSVTGLPVLCDLIGFTVMTFSAWWIRKLGALTALGIVATAVNFAMSSQPLIFVGFTAASIVFDVTSRAAGYESTFRNSKSTMILAIAASAISAAFAGFIIGSFFMPASQLVSWGGVAGWVGLHAAGGLFGGVLGGTIVNMLVARKAAAVH